METTQEKKFRCFIHQCTPLEEMEETWRGWKPSKMERIRRLAKSMQCILGLKRSLDRHWLESVCHIIEDLADGHSAKVEAVTQRESEMGLDRRAGDELSREKIQGDIAALRAHLSKLDSARRQTLNELLDLKGNIRVFCRVRPSMEEENNSQIGTIVASSSDNMLLKVTETKRKEYNFDKVFNPGTTQEEVYSEVEPVIKSALDGFNVCIFAYGQTGTGKTFTMEGKSESPGIVPRAFDEVFNQAQRRHHKIHFGFSMLEIYMGNVRDLLVPRKETSRIQSAPPSPSIKIDSNGVVEIENLVSAKVDSSEQVKKLYRLGCRLRTTASTMSNVTSSRSHCLVKITMTSFDDPQRRRETNKMWMIDLGGSERLLKTQARGKRLEEGKAINLSLSALGDVISALQRRNAHIPYRNSKLTQILKDSLGEDSKTLMLVHVSRKEEDLCETVCSLGFATRVRSIHLRREESKEQKAVKEAKLIALHDRISRLEGECQETSREISRLIETLKSWDETETSNGNHSNPSSLPNEREDNYEDPRMRRERQPTFMRPTICSKSKMDPQQPNIRARQKSQVHSKRRKCSLVRSKSLHPNITNSLPKSSCQYSMSSKHGTIQSSQDASECDIKTVIFPKERNPCNSMESIPSRSTSMHQQENPESEGNYPNLDWNYLQKTCLRTACHTHMVNGTFSNKIHRDQESVSSWRIQEDINSYTHHSQSCRDLECNVIQGPFKQIDSMPTDCLPSRIEYPLEDNNSGCAGLVEGMKRQAENCLNRGDANIDNDEALVKNKPVDYTPDESFLTELAIEHVCESREWFKNNRSPRLKSRRNQRALFLGSDLSFIDQKKTTYEEHAIYSSTTEMEKRAGNWHFLERTMQALFTNVLFALGLRGIGLGDEFYQGLTF